MTGTNDGNGDWLTLNPFPIAPFNIAQDSTTARTVCNEFTNQTQSMSYFGDTKQDLFANVDLALEMDAHTFAQN